MTYQTRHVPGLIYSPAWPAVWAVTGAEQAGDEPARWLFVVGGVVLLGLLYAAFLLGQHRHAKRHHRLLDAGRWALSKARTAVTGHTTTPDLLDRWLDQLTSVPEALPPDINMEMQADLELARDFQLAYLNRPYPKVPETHFEGRLRLQFHHWYHPALALGGDFFDIMPLADDTAGIFVADVMGHGARSALITAILRTLLRDLKGQGRNARHYMTEVNKAMCEIMRGFPQPLFASAFYFVPDTTSRVATYSTAGHPSPFHVRRSMGRLTRLTVPSPHGAALGIIPKEEYTGGHVRLIDNDAFIFFTDGVYEAANAEGEEFGLTRMEEVIRKTMYKNVQTIVEALEHAIHRFVGNTPLSDDICIVAVDVTTKPEIIPDEEASSSGTAQAAG